MKAFQDCDFVVTFTGESPSSRLIRGWARVLAYIDYQLGTTGLPESVQNDDFAIGNADGWSYLGNEYVDNGGDERHVFNTTFGECAYLTVTRLTDETVNSAADAVVDAYRKHDAALADYFAEHGAEHDDDCPQDDTCDCPLLVPMRETERELRLAVQRYRDLYRH